MSEEVKLLEELRPVGDGYYASNMGRIIGRRGKELRSPMLDRSRALKQRSGVAIARGLREK